MNYNYDIIYSSVSKDLTVESDKQLTIMQVFDKLGDEYGQDIKAKFYNGKMLVKIATIDDPDSKLSSGDLVPGEGEIILIAAEEKGGNILVRVASKRREEETFRSITFNMLKVESAEIIIEGYTPEDDDSKSNEDNKNDKKVFKMTVGEMKKYSSSELIVVTDSGERHIFQDVPSLIIHTKEKYEDEFVRGDLKLIVEV